MAAVMDCNVPDLSTAASLRKIRKPLVERKRRERINCSMDQLKALVLGALNKNEEEFAKMEKADILEMTVQYMRTLKKAPRVHRPAGPRAAPVTTTPVTAAPVPHPAEPRHLPLTVRQAGARSCAEETRVYLASRVRPELAQRAYARLTHLMTPASPPAVQEKPQDLSLSSSPSKSSDVSCPLPPAKRYLRIDPSLTKPLSVVVPEDRTKGVIWRPF